MRKERSIVFKFMRKVKVLHFSFHEGFGVKGRPLKILASSDFHGNVRAASKIAETASKGSYSLILVAGDLTTLGPIDLAREIVEILLEARIPVLHVPGNMDPAGLHDALKGLGVSLHGEAAVIEGLAFVGAGYEYGILDRLEAGIRKLERRRPDVFLTHAPPYGTKVDVAWSGSHVGSEELTEAIERYRPRLVVCGHIHEARGVDRMNETLICNPGPASNGFYAEIEIEEEISISLKRFNGDF